MNPSILDRIVADTRAGLPKRRAERPVRTLESMDGFARTPRSLSHALRSSQAANGMAIIAEAKKSSPSKGILRDPFDIRAIARSYVDNGAAALSILTEPLYFGGDLSYLDAARRETEGLTADNEASATPLLRKDFIVDPYQIMEARAWGADAILLIATVLDRHQAAELVSAAAELGLSVLMELYHVHELDRLDVDTLDVMGVNSRNLHTFEVDLPAAIRTLTALPDHVVRVAESGISSPDDIRLLRDNGIHAALVGEAFMRAEHPGHELAHLLGREPAHD
jgi:indole-3-glycerol phosphate synthase